MWNPVRGKWRFEGGCERALRRDGKVPPDESRTPAARYVAPDGNLISRGKCEGPRAPVRISLRVSWYTSSEVNLGRACSFMVPPSLSVLTPGPRRGYRASLRRRNPHPPLPPCLTPAGGSGICIVIQPRRMKVVTGRPSRISPSKLSTTGGDCAFHSRPRVSVAT